ncbi:hypothetical protein C1645_811984 [Glomus cerebriforme]|uniref:Uncharacterized protein n=1 Tax=Glomus cerebriforme TaxID=658196 RepID=A0A397TQY2_9GLOM|nr:hypothetical protein C1645_811984 [Glomus cerebriforme]
MGIKLGLSKFQILSDSELKVSEVTEVWAGFKGLGQVSEFYLKRLVLDSFAFLSGG